VAVNNAETEMMCLLFLPHLVEECGNYLTIEDERKLKWMVAAAKAKFIDNLLGPAAQLSAGAQDFNNYRSIEKAANFLTNEIMQRMSGNQMPRGVILPILGEFITEIGVRCVFSAKKGYLTVSQQMIIDTVIEAMEALNRKMS
jgi:hypothetical protein